MSNTPKNGTLIQDFTTGNITSQLLKFSAPLFLANLLQIVYNMVDLVIVSYVVGKTGLSAVAVGGDVSSFLTFISMGFSSATQIIIAPGYNYNIVRAIVTNFHQPQSTLLLLVSALIGNDWKRVYDYALKHDFRFLSYGDSSLLIP